MGLFSSLLPTRPELQLYGKLPVAKDYLRIGCSEGAARAWREWLDRVFSTDASDGRGPQLPWPMHFVLGAQGGDTLVGSLWNSTDAGGERRFPFTLFLRRKRSAARRSLAAALAEEVALWEAVEGINERTDRYRDGQELLRELRGDLVQPAASGGGVERIDLDDWLAALWPERRLDGLRETVEELAVSSGSGAAPPRRLQLAPRLPVMEQVCAWLFLLRRTGHSSRSGVPNLFLPNLWSGDALKEAAGQPPWVMVSFRELRPSDVDLLAPDEVGECFPHHVPSASRELPPPASEPGAIPLSESLRAALGDGDE